MTTFEQRAPAFAATAAEIARLRGSAVETELLATATASLVETGYDGWNGGTTFFTLMLEVPIATYVKIEPSRDELEKKILEAVTPLVRTEVGNAITAVVIGPKLADAARPVAVTVPIADGVAEEPAPRFWAPGYFRLFISHTNSTRATAHALKNALAAFGVAAFVAHDDVEPTHEWQAEIERALRTMDALAAIVVPGFVESRWCDQEVGVAMGRSKLIVPIMVGADPHGFMGKYQGIRATADDVPAVASKILSVLMTRPQSSERMAEAIVDRMVTSDSWQRSKTTMTLLEKVPRLNATQVARLVQSIDENIDVGKAFGVPERIRKLVSAVGPK